VAEAAIDVPLLGAAAPPPPPPPPPRVRVMQWNLLARGMASDGFEVEDVLAEPPADDESAAVARAARNLSAVVDPLARWARVREAVAAYSPDLIAVQELDWLPEAIGGLAALGYECGGSGAPLRAPPTSANLG